MWNMYGDLLECDGCGKAIGPPPEFILPPPPRPPSVVTDSLPHCNKEEITSKMQQVWYADMCETMPVFDASPYGSQSLQTSVIIAFISLLLILGLLISSLFAWKNMRKVQNFLSCKTTTRSQCINANMPIRNGCAVTLEDAAVHLTHHKPQVGRHDYNAEYHIQNIHYPSGYPMTRSPPFLDSSSPGPDPYRSHENIYEELDTLQNSDVESEPPLLSDDDFAGDELSLPGERQPEFNTLHISTVEATMPQNFHERANNAKGCNRNTTERSSVLALSAALQKTASTLPSSSHINGSRKYSPVAAGATAAAKNSSGLLCSMLRHATRHGKLQSTHRARSKATAPKCASSVDNLNNFVGVQESDGILPVRPIYDSRGELATLALSSQQQQQRRREPLVSTGHANYYSLSHVNNNNNSNNIRSRTLQLGNCVESELVRRNRINEQLRNAPAVATISKELRQYSGNEVYRIMPHNVASRHVSRQGQANTHAAYTPRQRISKSVVPLVPAYGYVQPAPYTVSHAYAGAEQPPTYSAFAVDEASAIEDMSNRRRQLRSAAAFTYQQSTQLYSPGDSSFGSDSGYSQHTLTSSTGRQDCETAQLHSSLAQPSTNNSNILSAALSLRWNWHKPMSDAAVSSNLPWATNNNNNTSTMNNIPNNNSGVSTSSTSTLEHSVANSAITVAETAATQNNNMPA